MKTKLIAAALASALVITSAHAQKYKADVPKSITTPDRCPARAGTLLRLYAPLEPWFGKSWKPGDFERID